MHKSTIKKKAANSGSFKEGYDPRRHTLSLQENRKGFEMFLRGVAEKRYPSQISAWVRKKIRGYYQSRNAARRVPRGDI